MGVPTGQSGAVSPLTGNGDIFESEDSVIRTLAVIRNSALPLDVKGKLRDLFMNYAGEADEGRRAELRQSIISEISAHQDMLPGLSLPSSTGESTAPALAPANKPAGLSWRTRPQPRFDRPVAPIAAPSAVVAESSTPTPPPVEPAPVTPDPIPEETIPAAPGTAPAATPAPAAAPVSSIDLKSRIDQIKREVNGRVGNPVNLIEADEKIGREYMAALLSAMKSVSGGGGEAAAASRLESAFQAAQELIARLPANSTPPAASPPPPPKAPEPEPSPAIETPAEPEIVPAATEPPASLTEPEPIVPGPETKPVSGLYHRPIDEIEAAKEKPAARSGFGWLLRKDETKKETPGGDAAPVAPQSIPTPSSDLRRLSVNEAAAGGEGSAPLHSLKESAALPDQMNKIKEAAEKRAEEAKKPITDLNDPEIQAGLEKLLAEWSLFRSSGLFGTGGRGIEHPLYKKLAGLPMAAVVAGRFEGSTPEIKQQITDYMNGWRYEQGILHEMGETFEHYLRRVIKQVIERQRFSARIGLA